MIHAFSRNMVRHDIPCTNNKCNLCLVWFGLIPITQADAKMDLARKEINSDFDVSFVMRASSTGGRKQLSSSEYNKLQLVDSVKDLLIEDFLRKYGDYVIVGFIYGGEILFETTYTGKGEKDKMDIEAAMGYVST